MAAVPVTVVILTLNEEANIAECLRSCSFTDDVHVVDSGSSDNTCAIARAAGTHVHHHPFSSFGAQRNWAIDNIPHKYNWIFHLDADERFTLPLAEELRRVIAADPAEAGFYVAHKLMFLGRWIRRAAGYPVYQMRFFHRERMRFRDHGHGQREDPRGGIGKLREPYLHYGFSKGLSDWLEKHNRYSTLEARQLTADVPPAAVEGATLTDNSVQRRRLLQARVRGRLPGLWLWRFAWMYFVECGFLDGRAGLRYCQLVALYEFLIAAKVQELRQQRPEAAVRGETTADPVPDPVPH